MTLLRKSTLAAVVLGLALTTGCKKEEEKPAPTPIPPKVTPQPVAVAPAASPAPVEASPAPVVEDAAKQGDVAKGDGKPAGDQKAGQANTLRARSDDAVKLVGEIRDISAKLKKISEDINGNVDNVYGKKDPVAMAAVTKQIEAYNTLSRELDAKTTMLKKTIEQLENELTGMK